MARALADVGWRELNLNLGCPSGTVTAKGKGSGMLRDRAALRAFLDEIFARPALKISVKTRIGFESPDEMAGTDGDLRRLSHRRADRPSPGRAPSSIAAGPTASCWSRR